MPARGQGSAGEDAAIEAGFAAAAHDPAELGAHGDAPIALSVGSVRAPANLREARLQWCGCDRSRALHAGLEHPLFCAFRSTGELDLRGVDVALGDLCV
jgi:hypothetical protein